MSVPGELQQRNLSQYSLESTDYQRLLLRSSVHNPRSAFRISAVLWSVVSCPVVRYPVASCRLSESLALTALLFVRRSDGLAVASSLPSSALDIGLPP